MSLPGLFTMHVIVVAYALNRQSQKSAPGSETASSRLKGYLCPPVLYQPRVPSTVPDVFSHQQMFWCAGVCLSVLGVCFLLLNVLSGQLFDSGCVEPIYSTTIAAIEIDVAYQWAFVTLCAGVLWVVGFGREWMHHNTPKQHALRSNPVSHALDSEPRMHIGSLESFTLWCKSCTPAASPRRRRQSVRGERGPTTCNVAT